MAKFIVVHSVKVATEFVPETFGRLTTIGPKFMLPDTAGRHYARQVCHCICGNTIVADRNHLKTGNTNSCSCLHKERTRQVNTKHGGVSGHNTTEYTSYRSMKHRCTNHNHPDFCSWGGRGIRVCDRWLEPNGQGFLNFLADMGHRPSKKHSIDRIDNDGHYCPENCCWATNTEQNRNRRSNVNLTFEGKTQCIAAWAEELGIRKATLTGRIYKGWSVEKALTTAAKVYNAKKNP
jgi:hypothetical protein